jgi:hypothetical protein
LEKVRTLVSEFADDLRFHHAMSRKAKLRTFASITYQATNWNRPRKVVARLECSVPTIPNMTSPTCNAIPTPTWRSRAVSEPTFVNVVATAASACSRMAMPSPGLFD